jgi:hypothetical protein
MMNAFELEQEIARLREVNAGLHDQIINNEIVIDELEFELDNLPDGEYNE